MELVAPGGNFQKARLALLYGADTVYVAFSKYGLRAQSDNLDKSEISILVEFAHLRNKQIYVVLNSYFHDEDYQGFNDFVFFLKEIQVDAVVVSDLGVMDTVLKCDGPPIHLSTQSFCLNSESALFYKDIGVKRVVLGREVSIEEGAKIRSLSNVEVEMFIHGSMCMSYSGICKLSNFTYNRDANRGGCKQNCRFSYKLKGQKFDLESYFMNSKDLLGITCIDKMYEYGIDALKIEGRMKTFHYLATVVKTYAEALAKIKKNNKLEKEDEIKFTNELYKILTREYCTGSLLDKASSDSTFEKNKRFDEWEMAGVIMEVVANENILVEVRNPFYSHTILELLPFVGEIKEFQAKKILDLNFENIEKTKPATLVRLPYIEGAKVGNILRKRGIH